MPTQIHFTTVYHTARKSLGLTVIEYCIADMIYHLSNKPGSNATGWCFASREYFSSELGIGVATVYRSISKLLELGLIIKHESNGMLRTTALWYNEVISAEPTYQNDSQPIKMIDDTYQNDSPTYQNDSPKPIKMIDYNNIDNNKYNNTDIDTPTPHKKYSNVHDITQTDYEEISTMYNVPIVFVASKHDDLINWHEMKPKKNRYENYRRGLMDWVKRDALKLKEGRWQNDKKRGIDATEILRGMGSGS
jgi:hypothetical protein